MVNNSAAWKQIVKWMQMTSERDEFGLKLSPLSVLKVTPHPEDEFVLINIKKRIDEHAVCLTLENMKNVEAS